MEISRENLMAEWAKKERFAFETICPLCLARYPSNHIVVEYPSCPECSSEAIDFTVEPFDKYLERTSLGDLDAMLAKWEAQEEFRPEHKDIMRSRILALRALKGG